MKTIRGAYVDTAMIIIKGVGKRPGGALDETVIWYYVRGHETFKGVHYMTLLW